MSELDKFLDKEAAKKAREREELLKAERAQAAARQRESDEVFARANARNHENMARLAELNEIAVSMGLDDYFANAFAKIRAIISSLNEKHISENLGDIAVVGYYVEDPLAKLTGYRRVHWATNDDMDGYDIEPNYDYDLYGALLMSIRGSSRVLINTNTPKFSTDSFAKDKREWGIFGGDMYVKQEEDYYYPGFDLSEKKRGQGPVVKTAQLYDPSRNGQYMQQIDRGLTAYLQKKMSK